MCEAFYPGGVGSLASAFSANEQAQLEAFALETLSSSSSSSTGGGGGGSGDYVGFWIGLNDAAVEGTV
eukprot:1512410-Rhodomonas_salina.1